MKGYVSSVEPMGLFDGSGVRFVVFLAGCNLRCIYCHNPETWTNKGAKEYTPEELMQEILKNKEYYLNGGVTFSGGEPLLQSEFLIEILKLCRKHNLHTALDTAGTSLENLDEILSLTDLVILDIKGTDSSSYKKMTKMEMTNIEEFITKLNKSNKMVWIRYVVVPNYNDKLEDIVSLKEYLKQIKNIEKIELLPYHSMGEVKYENMNIPYELKGVKDLTEEDLEDLYKII